MKTRPYYSIVLLGGLALALGQSELKAQQDRPERPEPTPERRVPTQRPEAMRSERIQQRIRELHAAGKHDEANQLQARLDQAKMDKPERKAVERGEHRHDAGRPVPDRDEPKRPVGPPPQMKIMHLKQAAEHLQAAGYPEQAKQAREEIGKLDGMMRREAENQRNLDAKRPSEEKLRKDETGRQSAAEDEVRGELKKIRREMEELRQQIRRMKEESESKKAPI